VNATEPSPLPQPAKTRWTPLRLGLVELYYYDQVQFLFHDGRLLLRGNNGTGKSKVLALTLPFLLDGSLDARRIEPDADRGKRMEWNLLLGDSDNYNERTGYTWLEFGRLNEATGQAEYCTLGCGLKAARGRGIVKHWFFITPRRIGELALVDDSNVVLPMERLRDQLAPDGQSRLFERAEDYRRAIDEKLFGFGVERYTTLVDLLIQLRQPQLSKKPDERALARALTDSLPPLGSDVLMDIAEAFRSLDEDQHRLDDLRATLAAIDRFLADYRRYARVTTRRMSESVRQANSSYEEIGRQLVAAEQAVQRAQDAATDLDEQTQEARLDRVQLDARVTALRESTLWGDASNLDRAFQEARVAHDRLVQAQSALKTATAQCQAAVGEAETDDASATAAETAATQADEAALAVAATTGLTDDHRQASTNPDDAARVLARRRDQIAHVEVAVESARQARDHAVQLRYRATSAETDAAERAHERMEKDAIAEAAAEALVEATRRFLAALVRLAPPDVDALVDATQAWAADPDWDFPVTTQMAQLADASLAQLAAKAQVIDGQRQSVQAELDVETVLLDQLLAGASPLPPTRPTRLDLAEGDGGNPFYALVDFAESVSPADRAGIEAALEAAGLLDAIVRPDGSVFDPATGDLLLSSGTGEAPSWPTLDDLLTPDRSVDAPDLIRGVLRGIGLGPDCGPVWVGTDGQFGLGSARGAWTKPDAEYLGRAARERSRQAGIDRARTTITDLEQQLRHLADERDEIDQQITSVRAERDSAPVREPNAVRETLRAARSAATEEIRAQDRATEADTAATDAETQAHESESTAAAAGDLMHVEATLSGVGEARRLVDRYETLLVQYRSAAGIAAVRREAATRAVRNLEERRAERDQREQDCATAERDELTAAERHATLKSSVGAAVEQLQAEMEQANAELKAVDDHLMSLSQESLKLSEDLGVAKSDRNQLDRDRANANEAREQCFQRFRDFAVLSLLRIAVPQADTSSLTSATAVVGLARQAEQALSEESITEDAVLAARQRYLRAVTDLRSDLGVYHHNVETIAHADCEEVVVWYNDRETDPVSLRALISESIAASQQVLSARERQILENYLMTDTATRLSELMIRSAGWVDELNRELRQRATSTGMRLRLRWVPADDAPAGFDEVRNLMLRSGAMWDEEERRTVGAFLQRCIDAQRDMDPAAGWDFHLAQAFDYRHWYTFTVERLAGQQWVSGAGPASTGERALGLTIPLFAAAASYYQSAGNQAAPRLILLDEAFAGIDDDARGKAMGLFHVFDLDVVMTSEREWGCYPSVPGLAIAQLSRSPGVSAVHVDRWTWDGAARKHAEEPGDNALAWHGGAL